MPCTGMLAGRGPKSKAGKSRFRRSFFRIGLRSNHWNSVASMRFKKSLLSVTAFAVTVVCAHRGAAAPVIVQPRETFALETKNFAITFQVGKDGRLYQLPIGGTGSNAKLLRDDEFYPQADDG